MADKINQDWQMLANIGVAASKGAAHSCDYAWVNVQAPGQGVWTPRREQVGPERETLQFSEKTQGEKVMQETLDLDPGDLLWDRYRESRLRQFAAR